MKRILVLAATKMELDCLSDLSRFDIRGEDYTNGDYIVSGIVAGIGSVSTVWSIMKYLSDYPRPDAIINIGIAGSFSSDIKVGESVLVREDLFADMGFEEQSGFKNLWESGLSDPSEYPYTDGKIICRNDLFNDLSNKFKLVSAITVNSASGTQETIKMLNEKYGADIETMEGAAVLYTAAKEKIPAIILRSISNFIEPRQKDNWNIKLALSSLSLALDSIFENMQSNEA